MHGGCIHDAEASSPLPPYLCAHVVAGLTSFIEASQWGHGQSVIHGIMPGVKCSSPVRTYASYAYEEVKYHDITDIHVSQNKEVCGSAESKLQFAIGRAPTYGVTVLSSWNWDVLNPSPSHNCIPSHLTLAVQTQRTSRPRSY